MLHFLDFVLIFSNILLAMLNFIFFLIVFRKMTDYELAPKILLAMVSCGIYGFIWGWQNAKDEELTRVMIMWTVVVVLFSVFMCTSWVILPPMLSEETETTTALLSTWASI